MKTLTNVDTWLPVFSGFYETIWETDNDEECEIQGINNKRRDKGMPEVSYDDIDWAYEDYHRAVSEGMTKLVGEYLKKHGFITGYTLQKLHSPKEYNFENDSINVSFKLDETNHKAIRAYLTKHLAEFTHYVHDRYTSCSGFISFHSNDATEWLDTLDTGLEDKHRLGAILNFIIENEEGKEFEITCYEELRGNGVYLVAENYDALVGVA